MRTQSKASRATARRSALSGDAAVRYRQVSLPDAMTRHMLSRFTAGVTSNRIADVAAAGGPRAWFERQLTPDRIPDHKANELWSWFPVLALTPMQKWRRYQSGVEDGWEMMQDLASWVMLRRLLTERQVEELMVDFWSNLVHVASPNSESWMWRVEYENVIRKHALGRFDDLLHEAIQHPAMGLYLNNVESTADAINENLGRELLECHTVGVEGGYTENEVIDSARILTGFHVDKGATWQQSYVKADHWVGRVRVMGFSSPNADRDGRPVLAQYLSYLAHHPATAQRICQRLATRFVSDTPSHALVSSLAKIYLNSGTDIVPVLRAMVASEEFKGSVLQKVRTPVEDAVATWTLAGATVARPHHEKDAANQFISVSRAIGQVVYDWPPPNGFPDVAPAWTGAGRILGSMRIHWYATTGIFPSQGITYRKPMDWMPKLPARFDEVVDYVVRTTLFMPCSATMLQAACVATDIKPKEMIDAQHRLIAYEFPRLLVSILDTPEHLSR